MTMCARRWAASSWVAEPAVAGAEKMFIPSNNSSRRPKKNNMFAAVFGIGAVLGRKIVPKLAYSACPVNRLVIAPASSTKLIEKGNIPLT